MTSQQAAKRKNETKKAWMTGKTLITACVSHTFIMLAYSIPSSFTFSRSIPLFF
jgi:hypothetical protein